MKSHAVRTQHDARNEGRPTVLPRLLGAALALGLLASVGAPTALAGGALIETTAPLADRSDASVKAAVGAAIYKAVRGAVAMGFRFVQLRDARVAGDEVAIQILATDVAPDEATEPEPGERPDAIEEDLAELTEEDLAEHDAPAAQVPATTRLSI
jgi:hypothetical protein